MIKSFREIEAKYIDYLSVLSERKVLPLGLLIEDAREEAEEWKEIFEWLNKKDIIINQRSVVFVAFGSECFLDNEEIEEIDHGIELSNIPFLWALNCPKAFPERFLGRVRGEW